MFLITVIKSSLALSLGLVGALSIVRFRAAIKDPEELSFLFLSIATGVGLGAGQRPITLLTLGVLLTVLYFIYRWGSPTEKEGHYLTISGTHSNPMSFSKSLTDILSQNCSRVKLRRWQENGNQFEASFFADFKNFEAFQKAKGLLDKKLTNFLRANWQEIDYHELIDAFPPNVMIGDIQEIKRLSPGQLDVELAMRSTVYKRGEDYVLFLTTLLSRMAEKGVIVDDSIRDNDGWYYRIAEVWEAKKRMQGVNPEVLVVLGPGFEGEDVRQDLVPLAMVVTKNGTSKELAEKYLQQGYQLATLEDLASNLEYLKTLDKTGWTAQRCQEAVATESIII
jgi:hypothetical protein